MSKTFLFTITAKDCRWEFYRGSGAGGQKRNKTSNCARCTHEPSGAVAYSEDGRSQHHNREMAFQKMAETKEFKTWLRIEVSRRNGELKALDKQIEHEMKNNTKIEVRVDGKWTEE